MPAAIAGPGDRAYNTDSSAHSQALFLAAANHLEDLLNLRDKQVKAAMQHYVATHVSDDYHGHEHRWNVKAQEVRDIIKLLKKSLVQNDHTAFDALKRAGNFVNNMA